MHSYKVYRDFPYSYRAIKSRFWDKTGHGKITEDTTLNIELEPYPGLDVQYNTVNNQYSINIADGLLPDYTDVKGTVGALAKKGPTYLVDVDGYYNYKTVGSPLINQSTGIISGFSSDKYITLPNILTGDDFILTQKLRFGGSTSEQCIWFSSADRPIAFYSAKLSVWQGDWIQGTTVYGAGIYWVRAVYKDGAFTVYCLTDNDQTYTLDTLPDMTEWNKEFDTTLNVNPFANVQVQLSRNNYSYWPAEMYLSGSLITNSAGDVLWSPKGVKQFFLPGLLYNKNDSGLAENYTVQYTDTGYILTNEGDFGTWVGDLSIPAHDVPAYKIPHFETVGTGISLENCVATGFNESSWIVTDAQIPSMDYFGTNALRLISRFKCPSDTDSGQGLWRLTTTNSYITWAGIRNNDAAIWSNGFAIGGTDLLSGKAGKYFWMQMILDSTGMKVYLLESDATSFEELPTDLSQWQLNTQKSEDIRKKITKIEMGYADTSEYWRGGIDLLNTRIDGTGPVDVTGETTWSLIWKPIVIT